jgi:hypothetical protein
MKLLNNIDVDNDIKFSKVRKTATNTCIIDMKEELYQTGWLEIISDSENNICLDATSINEILEKIDSKIIGYSASALDFSVEEMKNMYRPIFKSSNYLVLPINSKTVLFDGNETYEKDRLNSILKTGQMARFIISFKKLSFKDYELYVSIELHQIELS